MKAIRLSIALYLTCTSLGFGQSNDFYKDSWDHVYGYEFKQYPRSASLVVDSIYNQAKKEQDSEQQLKSLIYKSKFTLQTEEQAQQKVVALFKEEIATQGPITQAILHSVLADIYWQYFKANRWKLYQRTSTNETIKGTDFSTWDVDQFHDQIDYHFQLSLNNHKVLQASLINDYQNILIIDSSALKTQPRLFDFLANRALAYYGETETYVKKPNSPFQIDDNKFYDFSWRAQTKIMDSTSMLFRALQIHESLLSFHAKEKHSLAYCAATINKLIFINKHGVQANKDDGLEQALRLEIEKASSSAVKARFQAELARLFFTKGKKQHDIPTPNNDLKKALAICLNALAEEQDNAGSEMCQRLKQSIEAPRIEIRVEQKVPIQTWSRVLVNSKNIDSLQIDVYHLGSHVQNDIKYHETQAFEKLVNSLEKHSSKSHALKHPKDYHNHTIELPIPKLSAGNYLILAKNNGGGNSSTVALGFTTSTNIALLQDQENQVQLVDRMTGAPIVGATISVSATNRKNNYHHISNHISGEDGYFTLVQKDRHYNYTLKVNTKTDSTIFDGIYPNSYRNNRSSDQKKRPLNVRPFLFTDRSIYRPGQTVFFKGILVAQKGTNSSIVANESVHVVLKNVNQEEVTKLLLTSNEFGSFSGEFTLPAGGLTGKYRIKVQQDDSANSPFYKNEMDRFQWFEHHISVEEYKRPKFEVRFEPIKESFELADSIFVKGLAQAFAGQMIGEAKVSYKVTRNTQYSRPYGWYQPTKNTSEEISFGETITQSNGDFVIPFIASPDRSISPKSLPIFVYQITAIVTDLNGETHEASTKIKVGYQHYQVQLYTENKVDKHSKNLTFTVESKNLNDERINAKGELKIYKLKTPLQTKRRRPWPSPDLQTWGESDFEELFPFDHYSDQTEDQLANLQHSSSIDTGEETKIRLSKIQNWPIGAYKAIVTLDDPSGVTVSHSDNFELYNSRKKEVLDQKLFTIETNKKMYHPGEEVVLSLGTASKDLTLNLQIQREGKPVERQLIRLSNEVKEVKIQLQDTDIQGIYVHCNLVNLNSYISETIKIPVAQTNDQLTIKTATFRDKISPGSEQQWSFHISGSAAEPKSIELLASMYDQSLDQFKSHLWGFNPFQSASFYSHNPMQSRQSFDIRNFQSLINHQNEWYNAPQNKRHQMNWFGFNFANNRYINQQYLASLRAQLASTNTTSQTNKKSIPKGMISGYVMDLLNQPIPGATIYIAGSKKSTHTNVDGAFYIQASPEDLLEISFIGYEDSRVKVGPYNFLKIQLIEDTQQLEVEMVTAYGSQKRMKNMTYGITSSEDIVFNELAVAEFESEETDIKIRGNENLSFSSTPLYILDGKVISREEFASYPTSDFANIETLHGVDATALYGSKGANGVILIASKKAQQNAVLSQIKARSNLHETAFFFPHMTTDASGTVKFNFTSPESLTRWRLQLLAHDKNLVKGQKTLAVVTQKELMVFPNPPRFLREGDQIVFQAKISNLTTDEMKGQVALFLSDPRTGTNIDSILGHQGISKEFSIDANGNTEVNWTLSIPAGLSAVAFKIVAQANDFSDGESSILPVLSNRKLVTETLPIWANANEQKSFTLQKLMDNESTTLAHHQITFELTDNPIWYAIKSLPYLMEYPYECAEQTFARFYANRLGLHILKSDSSIQQTFKKWASDSTSTSKLEQNKSLKSIMLAETPWLQDAQSATEKQHQLAALFDQNRMRTETESIINKLRKMQMNDGGFPWFAGARYANRNITQHIVAGIGHLRQLDVISQHEFEEILPKAIGYLINELEDDHRRLVNNAEAFARKENNEKKRKQLEQQYITDYQLSSLQLHTLYALSFFDVEKSAGDGKAILGFYSKKIGINWQSSTLYDQALAALLLNKTGNSLLAKAITASIIERRTENEELGVYWKENESGWAWHQAKIETHALLIETILAVGAGENTESVVDKMQVWLLKNKQTQHWPTTKATTEAVYALLLGKDKFAPSDKSTNIDVAGQRINPPESEAGSGYYQKTWKPEEITPSLAKIEVDNSKENPIWGAMYWQYFEDLDQLTSAESPLSIHKQLYLKSDTEKGERLSSIADSTILKMGDLITVRIEITSDRSIDFIHMKDMRASGLEPIDVISKYQWKDGLGYYQSTKDASTSFFFDRINRGVYVFEYDLRVNNAGKFSNGITTIQSMYAPEFSSHSKASTIEVKPSK